MKALLPVGPASLLALLAIGCGRYEPEPEYPQQSVDYVAPPPTSEVVAREAPPPASGGEAREIAIGADDNEYADTDPSALTEFKPALDGHGAWVSDATYGTVWVPDRGEVGESFEPYVTAGHWTYSDETDYVWVSDYSWGWAPFHYGRWVYLPGHGWSWIPGRRYAGAWVTWRVGPAGYGYVGWAPAPPEWYWYDGVALGWSFGWYDYRPYYVYCPHHYFYHPGVGGYVERGPAAQARYYPHTQDYVPAHPSVGGSAPGGAGGGERVAAHPSVGGKSGGTGAAGGFAHAPVDRQGAPPSPGGGNPVKGPSPDALGIRRESVVSPPSSNPGLNRAQALARPSTAVVAGAAPPAHLRTTGSTGVDPTSRGPVTAGFAPGGHGVGVGAPSTFAASSSAAAVAPRGGGSSSGAAAAPVYRSSAPVYRSSAPSYSAPSYSAPSRQAVRTPGSVPSVHASAPAYHPSMSSTPSYHPSAPSYHPSVSSTPSHSSSSHVSAPASSPAPSRSSSSVKSRGKR